MQRLSGIGAILGSILLTTAGIAPAVAAPGTIGAHSQSATDLPDPPGNPPHDPSGTDTRANRSHGDTNSQCDGANEAHKRGNCAFTPNGSVDTNLTALELRVRAWPLLADVNFSAGPGNRTRTEIDRQELRKTLNRSFHYYTGFDRVNSSAVFTADSKVAAETGRHAPNVTTHLIASDERLARTATADAERTYSITEFHQERLIDAYRGRSARALHLVENESPRTLDDVELNDYSDDFDFVTRDDGGVVFTALDRKQRTDTWLSNEEELEIGTDPWDPDSDDDGLTDGQEVYWVTTRSVTGAIAKEDVNKQGIFDFEKTLGTDPVDADTDGDGY